MLTVMTDQNGTCAPLEDPVKSTLMAFAAAWWCVPCPGPEPAAGSRARRAPNLDVTEYRDRHGTVTYLADIELNYIKHGEWATKHLGPHLARGGTICFAEGGIEWVLEEVPEDETYFCDHTHTLRSREYTAAELCDIDLAFRRD